MYIPKRRNFSSEKARKKYIIKTECIADEFTVSLSKLYHDMDSSNKILALGEKYTAKTLPIYYFIYKKKIWPVYDDDPGQQECIYLNGSFMGAGAYTSYPWSVEYFIHLIDSDK